MKIQCIDRKTFELTDSSKKLGHITYDSLFSSKANAIVGNDTYKITPIGIFNTTISITKNDKEVASLKKKSWSFFYPGFQDYGFRKPLLFILLKNSGVTPI